MGGHAREVAGRTADAIAAYLNGIDVNLEPIGDGFDDIEDAVDDLPDGPTAGDIVPGIDDMLEDALGDGLDLERRATEAFNGWRSDLPELEDAGDLTDLGGGQVAFRDGLTVIDVDAQLQGQLPAPVRYDQPVFVRERFAPEWDVLFAEVDPGRGVEVDVVQVLVYEALEPGRANRSYTPPTSVEGRAVPSDNCDPRPEVRFFIPQLIEIGEHYFELRANDRSGNDAPQAFVKVIVEDNLPPDLNPPADLGVEAPIGVDSLSFLDVGCDTFLCQLDDEDAVLFPPPFFDFASASPLYRCSMTNSAGVDVSCIDASLPVGEESTLTWTAIDGVGNETEIEQRIFVRTEGENTAPVVDEATFVVAAGQPVTVPITGGDTERDPLEFAVARPPQGGDLGVELSPVFQTRFTLAGQIPQLTSLVKTEIGNNTLERFIVADPINGRLLEVVPNFDDPITDATYLGYEPHAITFDREELKVFSQYFRAVDALVIADWSTGRIYGIGQSPTDSQTFVDVSPHVTDAAHIAFRDDVNPPAVLITDRATDELVVVRTDGQSIIGSPLRRQLPFTPEGISFDAGFGGQNRYVITDWSNQRLVQWETELTGSVDGSLIREWDLSLLFETGTAARTDRPTDLTVHEFSNGRLTAFIVDDRDKEIERFELDLDPSVVLNDDNELSLANQFAELLAVERTSDGRFVALERDRITRFDLFGVSDAMIYTNSGSAIEGSITPRLGPIGQTQWADLTLHEDGDLLLLEAGNGTDLADVAKVSIDVGFGAFTMQTIGTHGERGRGIAYAASATEDSVLVLTDQSLWRYSDEDLGADPTLILEYVNDCSGPACVPELNDVDLGAVAVDGVGSIYLTDQRHHRIHKLAEDGSYFGWLGRCEAGAGCVGGASIGFGCTDATCTVGDERSALQGTFDFIGVCSGLFRAPHGYGRMHFDRGSDTLFVTDLPAPSFDYISAEPSPAACLTDPVPSEASVPRVQTFSSAGTFLTESLPGQGDNLLSFLEPGSFTDIFDVTSAANEVFVAEGAPLFRLHVLDAARFGDALDGTEVVYTPDPGFTGEDVFDVQANDGFVDGAPASITLTVIDDVEPPVLSCPQDLQLEATSSGGAVAEATDQEAGSLDLVAFLGGASASDNVTLPPVQLTHDAPSVFPLGTTTVAFTATDAVGSTSTCAAVVTVADTIAPEVTVADIVVEATDGLTEVLLEPAVVEVVGVASVANDAPTGFPLGETVVRWIVTDLAGNVGRARQSVTVVDTVPPIINIEAERITQIATRGYDNILTYPDPVVVDAAATLLCAPASGTAVPGTIVEVACTATDGAGQADEVAFVVDVQQQDRDEDDLADLVDLEPDANSRNFDDGEGTTGTTSGARVVDAFKASLGVRAEAGTLTACGDLEVTLPDEVTVDEDDDPEVVPGTANLTCAPSEVGAVFGTADATFRLSTEQNAAVSVPTAHSVSVDADQATAGVENVDTLTFDVDGVRIEVAPGDTVSLVDSAPAACACSASESGERSSPVGTAFAALCILAVFTRSSHSQVDV